MSLTKFFDIIDRSFIGRFVDRQLDIIEKTDPNRIFVENIRSFYGMPTKVAKFFCDLAVREGVFIKKYAVVCPNSSCERIIRTFDSLDEIPAEITCETCEVQGDEATFGLSEKSIITFYQLNKDQDAD